MIMPAVEVVMPVAFISALHSRRHSEAVDTMTRPSNVHTAHLTRDERARIRTLRHDAGFKY